MIVELESLASILESLAPSAGGFRGMAEARVTEELRQTGFEFKNRRQMRLKCLALEARLRFIIQRVADGSLFRREEAVQGAEGGDAFEFDSWLV